jgi:methylthioribose-1-phosphate isomerase
VSEPVQPPDPDRRRFFRQFAGEVVTSVGSMMGAAQTLQESSAEAARELLGSPPQTAPTRTTAETQVSGTSSLASVGVELDASTAGWRAPFRWDGDVCRIVDQGRLPEVLVDLELRGAADTVGAINDGALAGSAAQSQVAAVTLAMVAAKASGSRAFARRATVRGAANALRLTRQGSAAMSAALDRMLALLDEAGLETPGDEVAAALQAEAERIIGETTDDHGALVGYLVPALPGGPDDPLRVLVAGNTGAMGGGQFGTALSAVQTLHHAGRQVHALVPEGRPGLEGSRVAAWELRQAGVPHAVVTDAAAPGCIAAGDVQAVLVGADRICANGDVIATAGAFPLALACAASGTPFIVCAATTAVDLATAAGADATIEEGRPTLVLRAGGMRVAPEGTQVRNPLQDLVPVALVTSIVTETGVLSAPYGPVLAESVVTASARRSTSAGFAALLAQREDAATSAAAPVDADGAVPGLTPARNPVDVALLRNPPREVGA